MEECLFCVVWEGVPLFGGICVSPVYTAFLCSLTLVPSCRPVSPMYIKLHSQGMDYTTPFSFVRVLAVLDPGKDGAKCGGWAESSFDSQCLADL